MKKETKDKWKRREAKLVKKKQGMRVSGRSIFTLQEILKRKADEAGGKKKSKPKTNE